MVGTKKDAAATGGMVGDRPFAGAVSLPATKDSDKEKKLPAVIESSEYGLQLRTLDDMYRFGMYVVAAKMVPETDTAESVVIKLQYGAELGLAPMQSVQNIAVINRRPVLWGDAVPGVVRGSGLMADYREKEIGTPGQDDYGWEITSLRKGDTEPIVSTFTVADAKRAGLWNNQKRSPWIQYPSRMLKMRARTFNLRDNFPDVLKGIHTREEIEDATYEVIEDEKPGDRTKRLDEAMGAVVEQEKATGDEVLAHVEHMEGVALTEEPEKEAENNEAGTRLFDDLKVALSDVSTAQEMQKFKREYLATSASRLTPAQHKKLVELCKKKEESLTAKTA